MRRDKGPWIDRSNGERTERNFYDEREWRSLDVDGEKGNLKFNANSISKIFVTSPDEREKLVEFFNDNKSLFDLENVDNIKFKINLIEEFIKDI